MGLYRCALFCEHPLKVIAAFCLNMPRYSIQIYLPYLVRSHLLNLHPSPAWKLHASPPLNTLIRISGRDSFKGGRLWHPRCQFHVLSGDLFLTWMLSENFYFLARVCVWLSKCLIHISPNSKLISLTEGQIWSLLKLLFLGTNANSVIILNL
jgi:hypothetical protein